MSYYKITQIKSCIGLPKPYHAIIESLGLGKIGKTIYHPVSPRIAGNIVKVKELVKLELSDVYLTKAQMKEARKATVGFTVIPRSL